MTQVPIPPKRTQNSSIKRVPRRTMQQRQSDDESTNQNEIINDENSRDCSMNVCYGDYVELVDGRLGTVRYIGTPNRESNVIWYGISLTEQSGQNNGTKDGIKYWQDKPKHGAFVEPKQILAIVKRYVLCG